MPPKENHVTDFLFVYGSLMPDLRTAPFGLEERLRLAAESEEIGPATLTGTLYDLGDYPGAVAPPAQDGDVIHGTLLRLRDVVRSFAWLDGYEDFDAARDAAQNLYDRIRLSVKIGERFELAWVYVMRRVPPGSHRIASGMWHAPSPNHGSDYGR